MVMKSNNSKACAMQVGDTEFAIPKFSKMSSLKSLQVTQVFTILHILSRNNSETLASQALLQEAKTLVDKDPSFRVVSGKKAFSKSKAARLIGF